MVRARAPLSPASGSRFACGLQDVAEGKRRLSLRACHAALMITVYQEEPLFQLPFQVLMALLEIDETLSAWRSKHASMVHRMLGAKMGTGGSSGFHYLNQTILEHQVTPPRPRDLSLCCEHALGRGSKCLTLVRVLSTHCVFDSLLLPAFSFVAFYRQVFNEFFDLATFLVPRYFIPQLPESVRERVTFQLGSHK